MGASGREFVKIRMDKEYFEGLPPQIRERSEVLAIDVEGYSYEHDELHRELKKKSNKAYKDLKKREYDIRHNKINK